jgi:1-acyl-sn-glycerol-3-phosphate acyltransferase
VLSRLDKAPANLNKESRGMGILRLLYRVPWVLLHLLIGLPPTLISIATPARAIRIGKKSLDDIMLNWWSGTTCYIFGLRRHIKGEIRPGAQLVVANHISWMDIQLLHSISPMGFVAKAEIKNWKLAGRVAAIGDTVFHQRGSHDSASGVATVMAQRLGLGRKVAIFPEGGILPGHGIKRFHARMFAAAIEANVPVQPVMIRYIRDGEHYKGMTFLRGEGFVANIFRLLGQRKCIAEVSILPLINPDGKRRRELAKESEAAVTSAFESEICQNESKSLHG